MKPTTIGNLMKQEPTVEELLLRANTNFKRSIVLSGLSILCGILVLRRYKNQQ